MHEQNLTEDFHVNQVYRETSHTGISFNNLELRPHGWLTKIQY